MYTVMRFLYVFNTIVLAFVRFCALMLSGIFGREFLSSRIFIWCLTISVYLVVKKNWFCDNKNIFVCFCAKKRMHYRYRYVTYFADKIEYLINNPHSVASFKYQSGKQFSYKNARELKRAESDKKCTKPVKNL